MTKKRFLYLWCVLIVAIFLPAFFHGNSPIYREIAHYASNRWVHFLAYALVATIPVTAWRRRTAVLLSILPAIVSIVLQLLQAHASGALLSSQNVAADLFGLAAGILLGLNLRMMRHSGRSRDNASSSPSRLGIF